MKKKKKDNDGDNLNDTSDDFETVIDDDFRNLEGKSDTAKIVELLVKDKQIERQTILSPKQIRSIAILKAYAERYDLGILNTFANSFMELSVSRKGKRAEQIVEIAKANAITKQLEIQNSMMKKVRKE